MNPRTMRLVALMLMAATSRVAAQDAAAAPAPDASASQPAPASPQIAVPPVSDSASLPVPVDVSPKASDSVGAAAPPAGASIPAASPSAGGSTVIDTSGRARAAESTGVYPPTGASTTGTAGRTPEIAPGSAKRSPVIVTLGSTDTTLARACAGAPAGSEAPGLLAVMFRPGTSDQDRAAAAKAVGGTLAGPNDYGEEYVRVPPDAGPLTVVADKLIRQNPVTRVGPAPCPAPEPVAADSSAPVSPVTPAQPAPAGTPPNASPTATPPNASPTRTPADSTSAPALAP